MDSKDYSDSELKDIFDVVNSKHLHLKGRPKTIAKRQFVSCWKRDNKSLSAFDVFMALYHSEEKYDEDNEWFKQYVESNNLSIQEIKGKKMMPYAKYIKHLRWKDETIEELELKLENVMEDAELMSKQEHRELMKDLREQHYEQSLIWEDKCMKAQALAESAEGRCQSQLKMKDKQIEYYKKELEKLTAEQ